MKKTKIDYKPLFEIYAGGELTATQIAKCYNINRSSFLQCYKRYSSKLSTQINNKKLAGLNLSPNDIKGEAYELAIKALAKIELMLYEPLTPFEFMELSKALKAVCDSLGLFRSAPQVAIQNNFSNTTNEPKPIEVKTIFQKY